MRKLLSERPSEFKYPLKARVKAPLYFGGNRKLKGRIAEGIWRDGHVFYEIETDSERGCRFAAREEDVEPAKGTVS